ncbi:MAG: 2-C-methyl-D-erythritol 2,4-cyclodiphosphate synthase [Phycisphaerae bacterium]|nr:2-C-methyl-D-erythritol 2,4-cyclodiphosphate synthase [Phycisphaerae bacterium]|tara:strand:+ start:1871 stop:2392 length:522 start_codon:yes stop_codon:yes gene_type:complete
MKKPASSTLLIGHGYDLHRLEAPPPRGQGRPLVLGGVAIDHDAGPVGHSDGDVVLHAVTDALLGAMGEPDIGQLFPDDDPANDGRDSMDFLQEAVRRMNDRGLAPTNLDITIICQRPKISPVKLAMETRIAEAVGCDSARVNIKGKTHEEVDAVGEGRAIETHVVVLLVGSGS